MGKGDFEVDSTGDPDFSDSNVNILSRGNNLRSIGQDQGRDGNVISSQILWDKAIEAEGKILGKDDPSVLFSSKTLPIEGGEDRSGGLNHRDEGDISSQAFWGEADEKMRKVIEILNKGKTRKGKEKVNINESGLNHPNIEEEMGEEGEWIEVNKNFDSNQINNGTNLKVIIPPEKETRAIVPNSIPNPTKVYSILWSKSTIPELQHGLSQYLANWNLFLKSIGDTHPRRRKVEEAQTVNQ